MFINIFNWAIITMPSIRKERITKTLNVVCKIMDTFEGAASNNKFKSEGN